MAWRWKRDPEARLASIPIKLPSGETWTCENCKGTGLSGSKVKPGESDEVCGHCDGIASGQLLVPVGFCGLAGPVEVWPL